MKQKLYILSLIGWSITTVIVLLTLIKINLVEIFPFLFILFIGVFVVLIPSILYTKNNQKIIECKYENNIFGSNSIPLIPFIENTPNWILGILGLSFFTAIICFSKSLNIEGSTEIINGNFFLTNRGTLIREITKSEYKYIGLENIRGFFGVAMLFYSISILIYKKLIEWESYKTQ